MLRRDFIGVAAAGFLAACSKSSKIKLALNWKPEPQFGGFYAASYAEYGLDVEILPGGAGTPTVQMIGAGTAEFGIVSADEIVVARSKGNDVAGVFAVFQECPQGIMVHASRNLASIADVLKSGTLAIQQGLPYARLLQKKYGFEHVKMVPSPGGDITAFLNDPDFAQQCFVTSEPLAARNKGVAVKVFPVSDIGYNPYTTVLATSGDTLRAKPAMVKSMVDAVRQGWQDYLSDPGPVDQKMHEMNPAMDPATFAQVAEAQKPLIETGAALGTMTAARWEMLIAQLKDLGDIPQAMPATDCFRQV